MMLGARMHNIIKRFMNGKMEKVHDNNNDVAQAYNSDKREKEERKTPEHRKCVSLWFFYCSDFIVALRECNLFSDLPRQKRNRK